MQLLLIINSSHFHEHVPPGAMCLSRSSFSFFFLFLARCNEKDSVDTESTPRSYIMLRVSPGNVVVNLETVYESQR